MSGIRVYLEKRRGRKRWNLRWVDYGGGEHRESIGTKHTLKREAETIRSEREAMLNRGELPDAPPARITLAEAIRMDRELHADRWYLTVQKEDRALARLANVLGGAEYQLSKISRSHIAKLRLAMVAEGLAPNTQALSLRLIRGFYNRCLKAKLVIGVENPLAGQSLKMVKTKRTRIYSPQEIGAMVLAAPDPWWRLFTLTLAETGLRLNECLHCMWADVRLDAKPGEISVEPCTAGTFEIRGETFPLVRFSAKTQSSYRAVVLPAHLVDELRRFKVRSDGSPYLFLTLDRLRAIGKQIEAGGWLANSRPMSHLHERFRAIQVRAGISEPGIPHDFRASLVSRLKSQGISLDVCGRLLGHAMSSVLGKHYTDLEQADKLRVVEVLERAAATGGYGPSTVHLGSGGPQTLPG